MMPAAVECVGCGVTFSPEPRPGRQLQYHSAACKQAAWRRRTGKTGHEARVGKGRNASVLEQPRRLPAVEQGNGACWICRHATPTAIAHCPRCGPAQCSSFVNRDVCAASTSR